MTEAQRLLKEIRGGLDEKLALEVKCFARDPSTHAEQARGKMLALLEVKDIINSSVRKVYGEGAES